MTAFSRRARFGPTPREITKAAKLIRVKSDSSRRDDETTEPTRPSGRDPRATDARECIVTVLLSRLQGFLLSLFLIPMALFLRFFWSRR